MAEMTEELFRQVLEEAQTKEQIGLLIWVNWTIWDEVAYELREGNEHYDFALSQVTKGEDATITYEWCGFKLPVTIAVSVQKMKNSEDFFQMILNVCTQNGYNGPITLLPLNEVAEYFD